MTCSTMRTCLILPFALVFGITFLALVTTKTLPPVPNLEEMETFGWTHSQRDVR